jgi:hypothetical protein
MKKLLLPACVFLVFAVASCSHNEIAEDKVPAAVITAFKQKYPAAIISKWITESKDGKTIYEAVAKENGEEVEAEFNADGSFIKEH